MAESDRDRNLLVGILSQPQFFELAHQETRRLQDDDFLIASGKLFSRRWDSA
jgi:hypothetical protein